MNIRVKITLKPWAPPLAIAVATLNHLFNTQVFWKLFTKMRPAKVEVVS